MSIQSQLISILEDLSSKGLINDSILNSLRQKANPGWHRCTVESMLRYCHSVSEMLPNGNHAALLMWLKSYQAVVQPA